MDQVNTNYVKNLIKTGSFVVRRYELENEFSKVRSNIKKEVVFLRTTTYCHVKILWPWKTK